MRIVTLIFMKLNKKEGDNMTQQTMFATNKGSILKKKQKEENIQLAVCAYIKSQYPKVIFMCDLASGMKMPIWIAAKNKKMRSSRGQPDLFVAQPHEYYSGLFIELKTEASRLKSGGIAKSEHHDEQEAILQRLRDLTYKAEFACGFEEAKKLIDDYLQ